MSEPSKVAGQMLKTPQPKAVGRNLDHFRSVLWQAIRYPVETRKLISGSWDSKSGSLFTNQVVPPVGAGGLGEITGPDNPGLFRPEEVLSW